MLESTLLSSQKKYIIEKLIIIEKIIKAKRGIKENLTGPWIGEAVFKSIKEGVENTDDMFKGDFDNIFEIHPVMDKELNASILDAILKMDNPIIKKKLAISIAKQDHTRSVFLEQEVAEKAEESNRLRSLTVENLLKTPSVMVMYSLLESKDEKFKLSLLQSEDPEIKNVTMEAFIQMLVFGDKQNRDTVNTVFELTTAMASMYRKDKNPLFLEVLSRLTTANQNNDSLISLKIRSYALDTVAEEKRTPEKRETLSKKQADALDLGYSQILEAFEKEILEVDKKMRGELNEYVEKHKKVGGPLTEAIKQYKTNKEKSVLSAMAKIDSSNNERKMSPAEKELVTHAATSNLDIDPDKFFNFMETVQSFPNKKGFKPAGSCNVEHLKTGNTIVSALESDSSEDNDLPPIKKPGS